MTIHAQHVAHACLNTNIINLEKSKPISLQADTVTLGANRVFSELDVQFTSGKTTALLGPSGVGKTTLLKLLSGFGKQMLAPTEWQGLSITGVDQVAYLPQQDALLPWASITDNVLIGYKIRGQKLTRALTKKARDILNDVGLSEYADTYPHQLSGGMRQRTAIARTLMEDRSVILMDEPFSSLDPLTRYEIQDLASKAFENRTVIMVTHDCVEALRMAHELLIIEGPEKLERSKLPETPMPRAFNDPIVLHYQNELMHRFLGNAQKEAA